MKQSVSIKLTIYCVASKRFRIRNLHFDSELIQGRPLGE